MSDKNEQGRAAVTLAFFEAFARDQEAGELRSLEEYQAKWPGYEELIAEEFASAMSDFHADAEIESAATGKVAQYRIDSEIGRGAQGIVYRAHDEQLDRYVALKVFRRVLGDGVQARLRFQREARAASRLDHPGICTVYDSGVEGSSAFMAMRLVSGQSLAEQIAGMESPPAGKELRETVGLFITAAKALHAAHEAGLLHRDLKPGNLMVTPEGEAVILDFGLAGGLDAGFPSLTATGDVFGTPAYMPPEQVKEGSSGLDRTADVYSLGVSLYEAIALQRPYPGEDLEVLYKHILSGEKVDVRRLNPAISRDLAVVIATATDPEPDRRYQSAADFAEDLRRVASREPILARPTPSWLRAYRWMERNPVAATALLGLTVVLITAFGILPGFFAETPEERADRLLGIDTRRENEVEQLIRQGFQIGFGAEPFPARALFDRALAIEPDNATALVGRILVEMPMTDVALAILDSADAELLATADMLWLQGIILRVAGQEDAAEALLARAGDSSTDLRAFLEGHFAVRNFMPPNRKSEAEEALLQFRKAVMRSEQPRFHHYHSMLMAAQRAGDAAAMAEAERALVHHWPDSQATWEAIAQFFMPSDSAKAHAALERILELGPSAMAHLGLATQAEQAGDAAAAGKHYGQAIETSPRMAQAYLMRGNFLLRTADREAALPDFVSALRVAEGFPVPVCQKTLLSQLAALQDFERTIVILEELALERPDLCDGLREALPIHFSGDDLDGYLEVVK